MRRNYLSMMSIKGFAALLMFVSQVVPAWCLTTAEYGDFQYLNSIIVVLSFVVAWGTDRYCLKEMSLNREKNQATSKDADENENREIGGTLFATYSLIGINTVIVAMLLPFYLMHQMGSAISVGLITISLFVLLSRTLAQVTASVTKGLDRVIESELFLSVLRPLLFALPMSVIYIASMKVSLDFVLLLFGLSFFLIFVVLFLFNSRTSEEVRLIPQLKTIPELYRMSFFFFLVGVGLPLMANINIIELGNIRTSDEVALFSSAAKLVGLVLLALVSANLLIAPKLSPLFYDGKIADMRKLIRSNNAFVLALTGIPVAIIAIFSEQLLGIFGPKYVPAAPLLRTLVIGQAFSVLCGPVILTATMIGLQKHTSAVVLVCCAINWLLCVFLIPPYGAMGAVYATVVANVLVNGTLAAIIYSRVGLNVTMSNLVLTGK